MTNLSLFSDSVADVPAAQGTKYAGSKLKLLPYILDLARRTEAKSVLDGFSGSTRVSKAFVQSGDRLQTFFSNERQQLQRRAPRMLLATFPLAYQAGGDVQIARKNRLAGLLS